MKSAEEACEFTSVKSRRKCLRLLAFTQEEANEKFGFLLEAFEYGTPPHGGIAFGFDRIMMLLAGAQI